MPISENSIIDPGRVRTKVPLKKSTVAWSVGIVLVLCLVGYYAPKLVVSGLRDGEKEIPKSGKNVGTAAQIEAELKDAANKARTAIPLPPGLAASAPIPVSPLPPEKAVVLSKSTVDDNKIDNKDDTIAIQVDASARVSRSIALDSSGISDAVDKITGQGTDLAKRPNSESTSASALERVTQLMKAQAGKNSGDVDRDWLKDFAELKPSSVISPKVVKSQLTLIQGKVIPAVLGKSLNSDLPGDITAYTTVDIYDSLSGQNLLIPKGSMLIGEYSNRVRPGQDRLMFAFSRIVLPNGMSFDLPGNKGQDQMGVSGIQGDTNNHYLTRFGAGFLIAILADKFGSNSSQATTNIGTTGPTTAAGVVLSDIAKADLERNKQVSPTITISQGVRINVQVTADMEFPSVYNGKK